MDLGDRKMLSMQLTIINDLKVILCADKLSSIPNTIFNEKHILKIKSANRHGILMFIMHEKRTV